MPISEKKLDVAALVERLRSELPICPFAEGAPANNLTPEDPCPVCFGLGTDDAKDVCRGADTRVMLESADALTALTKKVDELEAEKAAIIAWIREQSDKGAEWGIASDKGTTRRAAFGGGSYALKLAADAIEAGEHLNRTALNETTHDH